MKLKPNEMLWIYSMGKRFAVTGIYDSDDEANAHCAHNPDDAVIACAGGMVIVATKYAGTAPTSLEKLSGLERFGLACLNEHREYLGDLDGGWLQDLAEEMGLLQRFHATKSCGERCVCDDFPTDCLRMIPKIQELIDRDKPGA